MVTCPLGSITNGANATVTITVTPLAAAVPSITNTVSATATETDPNAANNTGITQTTTVTPVVDLAVTKTDTGFDPVNAGQNVTYTVTVTNNGPNNATGVSLSDTLPASTTFVSATPSQGAPCTQAAGVVTCALGSINNGANATVTIVVTTTGPSVPSITNTASATANEADPNPADNTNIAQSTTVNPTAEMAVTKTDAPDPVNATQNVTYTITVTNNGPNAATNVVLSDTVPAGTTFVSFTAPAGWTASTPPVGGTGTVTATNPNLANGAVATFTLVVNATPAGVPLISNTASVAATEFDPTAGNNSDTETTTVNPVADLSVTKVDVADPVNVGQNITYTITVANAGPNNAAGVVVTDTLPVGVTFVSATPSQGGPCTFAAGTVNCPLGTINNGANATVSLVVTAGALGVPSVTNTASATTTAVDPNAGNNSGSQTTTVNPLADLSITKTDSPDPVIVNNNLTFTITVTNNGPSPASGVTVTDVIPAGLTFVNASAPAGVTCNLAAGTLTCTLAGLLNSGSSITATVIVTVTPAAGATVTNTATVSGTIPDPVAGNNSATSTTTVSAVQPATDFFISLTPILNTVTAGTAGTFTVTVGGVPAGSAFNSAINFSCLSPTGTCAVAPGSATPGTGTATAVMTVQTSALLGMGPPPIGPAPPPMSPLYVMWLGLASLMLMMVGVVGKRTQRRRLAYCFALGVVLMVASLAIFQTACANGAKPQLGPFQVTVTGTSGALSHSATSTLNIVQ